jgi:hypothetical protein
MIDALSLISHRFEEAGYSSRQASRIELSSWVRRVRPPWTKKEVELGVDVLLAVGLGFGLPTSAIYCEVGRPEDVVQ